MRISLPSDLALPSKSPMACCRCPPWWALEENPSPATPNTWYERPHLLSFSTPRECLLLYLVCFMFSEVKRFVFFEADSVLCSIRMNSDQSDQARPVQRAPPRNPLLGHLPQLHRIQRPGHGRGIPQTAGGSQPPSPQHFHPHRGEDPRRRGTESGSGWTDTQIAGVYVRAAAGRGDGGVRTADFR